MPVITVSEIIREFTVEEEITREVTIPARLSPAEKVVSVNARVQVTSVRVLSGIVEVSGYIRYTLFYDPEGEEDLESFSRTVGFTERLVVPGARPGLDASIDVLIQDIDWELLTPRTILLTFLLSNTIELFRPERLRVIEEIDRVRFERFRVQRVVQEFTVQRTFIRRVQLARELPDIDRVISLEPVRQMVDVEPRKDQLFVQALIELGLLYRPEREFELRFTTLNFPVSFVIDAPGVRPDMDVFADLFIQDIEILRLSERELTIRMQTIWDIIVITEEELELPTEVIGLPPGRIPIRRKFLIERIVIQRRTRIIVTETVELDPAGPGVRRVIRANGRILPGLVVEAERGGISISGTVTVDIIYVAATAAQPVLYVSEEISFTRFLNIEGVRPGMQVRVEAEVDEVHTDIVSPYQIRVSPIIDLRILVTERVPVTVIERIAEEVEVIPEEEIPPETFVYTVQQGDTLFKLAQRFNTTVEILAELNDLEDPSQLFIGQRLLIPR